MAITHRSLPSHRQFRAILHLGMGLLWYPPVFSYDRSCLLIRSLLSSHTIAIEHMQFSNHDAFMLQGGMDHRYLIGTTAVQEFKRPR
jgi:hypothetical protein